jgi:hypothetical protein
MRGELAGGNMNGNMKKKTKRPGKLFLTHEKRSS